MYHLVDEARLKLPPVPEMRNLTEAIFHLEKSRTVEDINRVLEALSQLVHGPQSQDLRRTLRAWMRTLLRRKSPAASIDESKTIDPILEDETMLQQTLERLYDEAMARGRQQGLGQGIEQGREEGLEQGLEKGLVQGREEGLASAVALQAEMRFGPLPDWVRQKLGTASEAQLMHWLQAMLTAGSLRELMGDG